MPVSVSKIVEPSEATIEQKTNRGVVEVNLEELRELQSEIETFDVYAVNQATLKQWADRLKQAEEGIQRHIGEVPHPPKQQHGTFRQRRKESLISRPRSEVGAPLTETSTSGTSSLASHVASTVHLLLDTLANTVHAEWAVCYVFVESTRKLVLIGGVGKRQGRPGDVQLHAHSGVESLVLENGIAVCMALASIENEFSDEQDKTFGDKSKSMLVFPIFKPGSATTMLGIVEVGNKVLDGQFTIEDETCVADCAFFLAQLISRFPSDITNPNTLDPNIFIKPRDTDRSGSSSRQPQMVYRTGHRGQPRRTEVLRDAVQLPRNPTIESVLDHVAQVNEAWRNAVLLNIELEHEIRRLHEALRVSRRETSRLQDLLSEQK